MKHRLSGIKCLSHNPEQLRNIENMREGLRQMGFNVLVVNCGSSSIKYQVIDMESKQELARVLWIVGIPGTVLTHKPEGKDKVVIEKDMRTIPPECNRFGNPNQCGLWSNKDLADIKAVGHR